MLGLFHSDPHPMRTLHDRHVAIAPKLDILDACVIQLKIEAGENRRDGEIHFRIGKTGLRETISKMYRTTTTLNEIRGKLTVSPGSSLALVQRAQNIALTVQPLLVAGIALARKSTNLGRSSHHDTVMNESCSQPYLEGSSNFRTPDSGQARFEAFATRRRRKGADLLV